MTQGTKRKVAKTSFVIPFTQFDWGDYYSDTDYLDFEEHGIYWNLLKRYYTTGPFDNNMKALQRVTRCPQSILESMVTILEEFFFLSEEDGCWHHKRCDEEIIKVKGISEVQSRKARKGISERKRNPDNGQFISLPAGAGQSPAIKEEDKEVISKNEEIEERYKDVINKEERLRLINKDIEDEEKARNLEEARAIIREKQERARMD
jgi:uncharacterized protein YdaU (DUF1376 family)